MKRHFYAKLIAMLLAIIFILGAFPGAVFAAFADDVRDAAQIKADVLSSSDDIIKNAESKKGPTKDRSEIGAGAYVGVYLNGELVGQGEFSKMWNLAMSLAPNVNEYHTEKQIEEMDTVEYVLNRDMHYDETWFGEGTMTISGKKFTIDLNGRELYRKDEGGSVIVVDNYSSVTIMDSNPDRKTRHHISEDFIEESGFPSPEIKGGIIAGGYHSTRDGGGIYIDNGSTVYLLGGTVCGNKADLGSGVCIDNGSTLDMRGGNAQICYNYSAGTSSDGGAVYLGTDCRIYGGSVHHNLADDYGGGIRADGGNILIRDVTIYNNRALELGGGIYITRTNKEQTVTVDNCKIVNNYADEEGGGIYIYNLMLAKLNNCVIQNNAAGEMGGGVFLCDDIGTDIQLSGDMFIRNNFIADMDEMYSNQKSNLYIEGDDDLIVSSIGVKSEIWLSIGEDLDDYLGSSNPITAEPTNASHLLFHMDNDGYHVARQEVPAADNYRYLYIEKGKREENLIKVLEDYEPKVISEKYTVRDGEYKGVKKDITKGYFEFRLTSDSSFISASPFYYSDGYFLDDPSVYNEHLASMSFALALSALGRRMDAVPGNEYANHFGNVKQLFADIGCDEEAFFINDDYQKSPEFYGGDEVSTIGVAISKKKIEVDGEEYTLLPVAIRGGDYGMEWASNVVLGEEGEAKGFSAAASVVIDCINEYFKSDSDLYESLAEGRIKFWVVGYSRSGATANIASKRLVDEYAALGNDIFCYTFEAPRGGIEDQKVIAEHTGNGTYPTIHNTINENDFITYLGPGEMGFIRYGTEHLIGSDHDNGIHVSHDPNSEYYARRQKMIEQLKAINPYYCFNDYWEIADVNIILSNIPIIGTDLIDKGEQSWDDPNPECRDPAEFIEWFVNRVVMDGFDAQSESDLRYAFSVKQPLRDISSNKNTSLAYNDPSYNFAYSEYTIEQALCGMFQILYGLPDEDKDKLLDVLLGNAGEYMDDTLNIFDRLSLYLKVIKNWEETGSEEREELINEIVHNVLNGSNSSPYVWEMLNDEQSEILAESLPVLLYAIIRYASEDYKTSDVDDDGMWGVGTFVNNMDYILGNHYEEVTLAWLRSNDSYYKNDKVAYKIEKDSTISPTSDTETNPGKISLSAERGSSIFYSLDGGKTWQLYVKPIKATDMTDEALAFSISRGVKSETVEIPTNKHVGAIMSDGTGIWIVAALATVALGAAVFFIVKKRKAKPSTSKTLE